MKELYLNFMLTLIGLLAALVVLKSCLPEPKPAPPAARAISPAPASLPCPVTVEARQPIALNEAQQTEQRKQHLLAGYNALQQRLEQH